MTRMLAALAALFLAGSAFAEEPAVPKLTVTATGKVSAEPDVGYITVGVMTKSKDAQQAADANAVSMTKLFAALEKEGVKKKEVQTTLYDIHEDVQTIKKRDADGADVYETRRLGFVVSNNVRVTVCDLKSFGKVLTAVIADGANSVQGISFGSTKAEEKLDEARKLACATAKQKAGILATGLDVKLESVLSISEDVQRRGSRAESMYSARAASVGGDAPVSGGSLEFAVDVVVVWKIAK